LRDEIPAIRAAGAELVLIGNGARIFAEGFRDEMKLDGPLLVDPDLRSYRAAGLRRGRVEILSPRLPLHAVRALWSGHRQGEVQGDAWQLGGVFVIAAGGNLLYEHRSREAGDHPPVAEVLAALRPDATPVREAAAAPVFQAALARVLGALADPTIVLSFSRPGFALHALGFQPDDLDVDLSERRCLVTGANQGLGYESALALADLGAEVTLLCRSAERGEAAAARIREQTGNQRVTVEPLDVADLDDVRRAAARLRAHPVDVLVHNAGALPDRRTLSPQGIEFTMAAHVVGPHLLTRELEAALASAARVVWVSSGGMYSQKLDLEDWNWESRPYDGVTAYAQTKRMQVVLSELWAERLRARGVCVNAMHPGWADTSGVRTSLPRFHRLMRTVLRTPAEGADTIVWLAASAAAAARSGEFFLDREARSTHYLPFTRESEAQRQALWELCERLLECGGHRRSGSSSDPERR